MPDPFLIVFAALAASVPLAGAAGEPLAPMNDQRVSAMIYKQGDTELEGFLARPAATGTVPVVLIFHQWMGPGDYERKRAADFAGLGYAAFVADVYGKGVRAKSPEEAMKLAGRYRGDRPLLRARARAAFGFVRRLPGIDPDRVAAIGYCFGGGTVLELARDGADLRGAVSVHGNLDTPLPAKPGAVKAAVLVQHGAEDPHVTDAHVAAFIAEMRAAKADWQLTEYGGAVHAFSDPGAGNDPSKGAAYNAKADARSFAAQTEFLKEVFKR